MNRKYLTFVMRDGSTWGVPVSRIADDRARHYAFEFGGDVERSLKEDTLPLFEANPSAIEDWATGDMDWADVVDVAVKLSLPPELKRKDFVEAWLGPKRLEER
jgi:hypothetical protein